MSPCTNDRYQRRAQICHYQRKAGATRWGGDGENKDFLDNTGTLNFKQSEIPTVHKI
jgi:hypothetical protein